MKEGIGTVALLQAKKKFKTGILSEDHDVLKQYGIEPLSH
jgi:hypothetical protein